MILDMTGKRDAHERLPEVIAAAVRVFTREGYRLARMSDVAAEFEKILRELFELESRTREAADMLERSARELPELADLLNAGIRAPVLAALTEYLAARAE